MIPQLYTSAGDEYEYYLDVIFFFSHWDFPSSKFRRNLLFRLEEVKLKALSKDEIDAFFFSMPDAGC